jgi:hypothetical protein
MKQEAYRLIFWLAYWIIYPPYVFLVFILNRIDREKNDGPFTKEERITFDNMIDEVEATWPRGRLLHGVSEEDLMKDECYF